VDSATFAAKARSRGARARREFDDRRFEVAAARSESLARVEDEMVNMVSCHGLDADSINSWVDGTHVSGGPEGDNIIPFVTNPDTSRPVSGLDAMNTTETVSASVDPCVTPFGTTTLVAGCGHNVSRESLQKESIEKSTSTFPAVTNMVTGIWNIVTGRGGMSHIVRDDPPVTAVHDIPLPPTPSRLPPPTQPPPPSSPPYHITPLHHHTITLLPPSLSPPPPPCFRLPPGFPERILADRTDAHMNDLVSGCANHASRGGGGRIGTLLRPSRAEAMEFVAEAPTHAHSTHYTHNTHVAHNARFSSADRGGDETWNTATCRDILSDRVIDLTSNNTRVGMTESSFNKSCQRPSNDVMNVRDIPSTVIANIPMNGDISSGCYRDGSDNVMTNLTAHCSVGVGRENAVILPSRQVTRNQLMDQVQVDPTTQIKVIDTFAQGSRDGLGGVVGDIITPQADRNSEFVRVASQQPLAVPPSQSVA
jgi:hypothetical protein